jgi:hypothetical protein
VLLNPQGVTVKPWYLSILLMGASWQVDAVGRLADVTIIDRDTGTEIPTHFYRGEHWVAGSPGARYGIFIHNRSGERVLAVTAVDGVNVISGASASWNQTGYVFDSYAGYEIDGWRKSTAEVAAFEFAPAPGSYAALTGRPENMGVIGVALFRERPAPPVIARRDLEELARPAPSVASNLPSRAPAATMEAPRASAGAADSSSARAATPLLSEKLGTAHGHREESHVVQTNFDRLQDSPNEVIRIRYDSLPNLIAMGVVRPSRPRFASPDPFPESPVARYVPDPPEVR